MILKLFLSGFIILGTICLSDIKAADFELFDSGDDIVDYEKFGVFYGTGTDKYRFEVTDSAGLKKAVGEGIFPNTQSVLQDPEYKKLKKAGALEGSQWNFTGNDNTHANFFKWATTSEEPGVKMYNVAEALEKSGNIRQAIKAYYSIIVHFPKSFGITYWGTPWYVGPVAIDKIKYLTSQNPKLEMKLEGASIQIRNSFDIDMRNDIFIVSPGKIVKAKPNYENKTVNLKKLEIIKTIGKDKIKLIEYSNKNWQLTVNDKPYYVRGIAYSPNKIGLSPDNGTLNVSRDWMYADFNKNGIIDGPYESWVDINGNNKKDKNEKVVGDFQLMKEMGVNTLRLYHHADFNKKLLKEGYEKYGFMYLMGDFIGMYAVGSKAEWYYGTDYTNPEHQKNMLESVKQMVEEYKNEPYILMWVLGNENNYAEPGEAGVSSGSGCRAKIQPEAYYKFVNEAAKLIKSLDPLQRPVAICNGDILYLDKFAEFAPDVDIFGVNAYRGEQGFGSLWQDVLDTAGRPVIVTEYGCSAYNPAWDQKKTEEAQAKYLRGNWMNIENNFAGHGAGNALGGILFEWTDEWWKANSDLPLRIQQQKKEWYEKKSIIYKNLKPDAHDIVPQFGAPFLDGWSYEEWLGITSQGDGSDSPFMRQLRPAYFEYKKMWKKYK